VGEDLREAGGFEFAGEDGRDEGRERGWEGEGGTRRGEGWREVSSGREENWTSQLHSLVVLGSVNVSTREQIGKLTQRYSSP